jgi:mediator of replication checkpoint protein 1
LKPTFPFIGRNQETKAFYDAYQQELIDDDLEFDHLQTDTRMVSDDEDEETRKVVLTEDLNAELREAARNREVSRSASSTFDITNLW